LYLVLSRTEVLIDWSELDALANLLRSWATQKKYQPLRLLAEFSTAAALVSERLPSFNIAPEPIVIGDMTELEALELARLYDLPWNEADIKTLFGMVGGHPHLLRSAMFEAASADLELQQILDSVHQDGGGIFRSFLERNLVPIFDNDGLRKAACSIMCGKRPPAEPPNTVEKLCAAGIVRRGKTVNDLSLAYPLFKPHLEAACQ
jgi:hypothetical protein